MTDIVDPATRSRMMSGIRGKNTKPELLIRSALHKNGFRFRLHDRLLPGKPDIVLRKYNSVIQVNGCFWHGHDCHLFKLPTTRKDFWREKIKATKLRDQNNIENFRRLGWRVLTVWECALKNRRDADIAAVVADCISWIVSGNLRDCIQSSASTADNYATKSKPSR